MSKKHYLFKPLPARRTFIQPQHDGFKHHLLFRNIEKVAGDDFCKFVHTERQKLFLEGE